MRDGDRSGGMTRGRRDEHGFSLIELTLIVVIIAILIAIAIPLGFGAKDRAEGRVAQANLRAASAAVFVESTDDGFFPADAADLAANLADQEMAFSFIEDTPADATDVAVLPLDIDGDTRFEAVIAMSRGDNGRCYAMRIAADDAIGYAAWDDTSCEMADASAAAYGTTW